VKVAVLKGGSSLERQVSLRSGGRVEDALERLGHEAVPIDVGTDLIARLRDGAPDIAFVALHGRNGEDGTVQELLEILGIPYTGSGVLGCIRCMDKVLAKHLLGEAGVPTPEFFAFSELAFRELGAAEALPQIEERLEFPIVVKPAAQGSALGIKFARTADDVPSALVNAFSYDDKVLLERHIDGRELAVSMIEQDGQPLPLPIVEAIPHDEDFFDFESRYEIGRTEYQCPPDLSAEDADAVAQVAKATWRVLGCRGFARADIMLPAEGGPQVLEVNSIPGLTETSLLPMACEAADIGFDQFVERALDLALARSGTPVTR
jgi:D-alanine-D-alanine ligase